MSRDSQMNRMMAGGMLGLQQSGNAAGAFAIAYVMHTLSAWEEPTGVDLEKARAVAARIKLSEDLAIFLPPEPGRFASRARKDTYRSVLITLKRIDEFQGEERASVIGEIRTLLGAPVT
ncbi:MAG: hypothetical protein Q7W51_01695 [Coriobacteriia bacterium]|nr:hypothetical protein [Coriobacteriia bacterium]